MGLRGWTAVRALPYLDASAKDQMREAVKTYMAGLDKQLDATPSACRRAWARGADRAPWLTWPSECTFCTRRFLILWAPNIRSVPSITFSARTRYRAHR